MRAGERIERPWRACPGRPLPDSCPIFLELGTRLGSNACWEEPSEVPDADVEPHRRQPGYNASKTPWSRAPTHRGDRNASRGSRRFKRCPVQALCRNTGSPSTRSITTSRPARSTSTRSATKRMPASPRTAPGGLLRRQDGSLAEGQARRQASGVGSRRLVGPGEHPARRALVRRSTASGRIDYLNTRERLYCFDGFAGWDPKYRIKVRVICSRPYHALFMHTMLIRPTKRGAGGVRQARLRDLQRRRVPRQPPHGRRRLQDEHLPEPGGSRADHPGHRIRGRDEEGRVHGRELLRAEARPAVHALLGDGRPADRAVRHCCSGSRARARRRSRPTRSAT